MQEISSSLYYFTYTKIRIILDVRRILVAVIAMDEGPIATTSNAIRFPSQSTICCIHPPSLYFDAIVPYK
jgi:hypothetical protein